MELVQASVLASCATRTSLESGSDALSAFALIRGPVSLNDQGWMDSCSEKSVAFQQMHNNPPRISTWLTLHKRHKPFPAPGHAFHIMAASATFEPHSDQEVVKSHVACPQVTMSKTATIEVANDD